MNPSMLERIMEFEPLYAATLPPPPPRLVRENAERLGPEYGGFLMDSDDDTVSGYNTDDDADITVSMDSDSD